MRVRPLRSLSYAGDSKKKEYEYFFFLESGVSNFINKLSRTGNQKNKERKRSYFFDLVRVREKISLGLTPNKLKNRIINLRSSASNLASQVFSYRQLKK